jgi:uncharacterized protein YkwD
LVAEPQAASHSALTPSEAALLAVMNEARAANHVPPLHADTRLERAARAHSSAMLRSGSFSHGAVGARIRHVGVKALRVGENLAWGVGQMARARSIVRMWLASPAHRQNLLDPRFKLVGVGAIRGSFSGYSGALMITTDFAGS